jgi:hypothetical protein
MLLRVFDFFLSFLLFLLFRFPFLRRGSVLLFVHTATAVDTREVEYSVFNSFLFWQFTSSTTPIATMEDAGNVGATDRQQREAFDFVFQSPIRLFLERATSIDDATRDEMLRMAQNEEDDERARQLEAFRTIEQERMSRMSPSFAGTPVGRQHQLPSFLPASEQSPPVSSPFIKSTAFVPYKSPLWDELANNAGVLDAESITVLMQTIEQDELEENRKRMEAAAKPFAADTDMSLPEPPLPVRSSGKGPSAPPMPSPFVKMGGGTWAGQPPPRGPPLLRRNETDESTRELIFAMKLQDEEDDQFMCIEEEAKTLELLEEEKRLREEELARKWYVAPHLLSLF